jgi:hypothetical protein
MSFIIYLRGWIMKKYIVKLSKEEREDLREIKRGIGVGE